MGKSRNRKWYEVGEDYEDYKSKKKGNDRRSEKKRKNALRSKNFDYLYENESDD